jgi:hypothetical protein
MFKDNWKKTLIGFKNLEGKAQSVGDFKTIYYKTLGDVIDLTLRLNKDGLAPEGIQKEILSRVKEDEGKLGKSIIEYRIFYRQRYELVDEREQEAQADLMEKIRFLIFRVATTIVIAAVILGTAMLAHQMGIPLPFSMRIPTG